MKLTKILLLIIVFEVIAGIYVFNMDTDKHYNDIFEETSKDNKYKISEIYNLFSKTVKFIIQHHDDNEFVCVSTSLDELLAYVYELSCKEKHMNGQQQCLDFWDDMYKYQMGNIREITDQII